MDENELSKIVIGSAIEVHRILGPGLLESIYQKCLAHEIAIRGLNYQEEAPLCVGYKKLQFEAAFRIDMLVEDKIIIELKAVEKVLPVHEAQLLSYLRLTDLKLGLLINFHVPVLKYGIKRIVSNL